MTLLTASTTWLAEIPNFSSSSSGLPLRGISVTARRWTVKPEARSGNLVALVAGDDVRPESTQELTQLGDRCDRAVLMESADYFIGDRAKSPFPLKPGEELWAEVTVPPSGPPRPLQLAISSDGGFKPLTIR